MLSSMLLNMPLGPNMKVSFIPGSNHKNSEEPRVSSVGEGRLKRLYG